jgi:hypothetical protein
MTYEHGPTCIYGEKKKVVACTTLFYGEKKIINTILGLIETSSYDPTYEPGNLLIISTRQNKSSLY